MTIMEEIPGLPRSGGPPVVPNNGGIEMIKERFPVYEVTLPAGVFHLLWELVEARATKHYNQYRTIMPDVAQAYVEAVKAFRIAIHGDLDVMMDDADGLIEDELLDDDEEELSFFEDEEEAMLDDDDELLDDEEVM